MLEKRSAPHAGKHAAQGVSASGRSDDIVARAELIGGLIFATGVGMCFIHAAVVL